MPKSTLLELTQDILSDMSSDDVNSINDTPDALQVAGIIKSSFFDIMDSKDSWPHLRELMTLDSATITRPTHMKLPVNTKKLELLKYDKQKAGETRSKFSDVKYLYPDEFLGIVNTYNTDQANVTLVTDTSGATLPIKTDTAPTYWTSFDDEYIVFNSYDSGLDATLMASKSQCVALRRPGWITEDEHIPDLPEEAFSRLLAEAKSISFARIKQMEDATSGQQAFRQRNAMSRKSWVANGGIRKPNYARTPRK